MIKIIIVADDLREICIPDITTFASIPLIDPLAWDGLKPDDLTIRKFISRYDPKTDEFLAVTLSDGTTILPVHKSKKRNGPTGPKRATMTFEYFCLRCETEIGYDETEYQWCCECFATITEPDEDGMPNLAFVPEYWINNTEGRGKRTWKELDE